MNGNSAEDSHERTSSRTSSVSEMTYLEHDTAESVNVASCFICDVKFEDKGCIPLSIGCTSYSNTRLPTKIGQLMGDDIMVVIARDDMLCKRCTALLNRLDRLEKDMGVVQKALRGHLNRKYKLLDEDECNYVQDGESSTVGLPVCKVEDETELAPQASNSLQEEREEQVMHKCVSCEYKTTFPGMLKAHQARCRSRRLWYRCSMCDKKFPSEKHARQHIMAAHLSNWPCHYCGANFSEESEYTCHMKTHVTSIRSQPQEDLSMNVNLSSNYYCNVCSFQTTTSRLLDEHMNSHVKDIGGTCSKCNLNFESNENYLIHLKSHKSFDDKIESFNCNFCSSTFTSEDEFNKHLDSHEVGEQSETVQVEEGNYHMTLSLEDIDNCIVPASDENPSEDTILPQILNVDYHICNICSLAFDNKTSFLEHNKLHGDDQHSLLDKVVIGCDYTEINDHLEEMFKRINSVKKSGSDEEAGETNDVNGLNVCTEEPDEDKSGYHYDEHCDTLEQESLFLLSNADFVDGQQVNSKVHTLKMSNSSVSSLQDDSDDSNDSSTENVDQSENRINNIFEMVRMKKLSSVKLDTAEMPLLLGTLGKYPITSSVDNIQPEPSAATTYTDPKSNSMCSDEPEDKRMYVCITCSYETSDTDDLQNHVKIHDNNELQTYICSICNKEYLSSDQLNTHLKNHHKFPQKKALTCSYCLNTYADKFLLQQHMQETHPRDKQLHLCIHCCKVLPSKKALRNHEESHTARLNHLKFTCGVCNQSFQREKQLKDHISLIHRDPHCRFCGKEIHKAKTLKLHELRHIKNKGTYDCSICTRKFKTRTGLTHHQASHTGEYKYRCNYCGNGFMSRMMLEEHKSKHTKEERYVCDICGKKFSFQSTYWIHRKWHDNPYPYKCSYCDRMFRHSSLLAVHKRKHTGERPYKCLHCPMTFTVGGTLKRHMILHTGKYPFSCDECKRGFTTKHKYAAHMAKSHGEHDLLRAQGQPCQFKVVIPDSEPSVNMLEPQIELVDWEPDDDEPDQEFSMEMEHTGTNSGDDCATIVLQGSEEMVPCTIIGDSILVNDMAQRVVEIVMDDTSQTGNGVTLGDDTSMLSTDLWSYQ